MNAYTYHLWAARHDANRFGNATAGDIIIALVGIVALVLFIRAVADGNEIMLRVGMIGVTIDFPAAFLWDASHTTGGPDGYSSTNPDRHCRRAPRSVPGGIVESVLRTARAYPVAGYVARGDSEVTVTTDEQRAYLLTALRKAPEGSARRVWAQSMLAQLDRPTQAPKATPTRKKEPNYSPNLTP